MTNIPIPGNYTIMQLVRKNFVYYGDEQNFFRFSDDAANNNAKNLLMPARDPQTKPARFYIFNWESQHRDTRVDGEGGFWSPPTAWEMGLEDDCLLVSRPFTGAEIQQFIFEPHPTMSDVYYIQSVASALYLYKSKNQKHGHDCLRQSDKCDEDRFHFALKLFAPVSTPPHKGLVRDPRKNPIPAPPKPKSADDIPPSPNPVLLGETLLPFYQVAVDADAVGNLRLFQVQQCQAYVMKREQYWKFRPPVIRLAPNEEMELEVRHEAGLTTIEQSTIMNHTGLMLNVTEDVNAGVSMKKANFSASHAFGETFQHDTTSTMFMSEQVDVRKTSSATLSFYQNAFPSMVVYWILVDRWCIGENVWENPSMIVQCTSFPEVLIQVGRSG